MNWAENLKMPPGKRAAITTSGVEQNEIPDTFGGTRESEEVCNHRDTVFTGIKRCPDAGDGVHQWCFYAYNTLRERGVTHEEAVQYCVAHASRTLTAGDIPRGPTGSGLVARKPRVAYREALLKQVAAKANSFGVAEIKRRSPLDPAAQTPATFLRHLFRPGEKVLIFYKCNSQGQIVWTCPPEAASYDPLMLDPCLKPTSGEGAWMLANAVTGEWACLTRLISKYNPSGRTRRAVETLSSCRYCVVESDAAPEDLWIKALVQIPLPIVAVTSSAGKSIHALINTGAQSLEDWRRAAEAIADIVIPLGADPATLNTPAQLTRIPGFYRASKNRWQDLLYLNPAADNTPIISQAERAQT
jgi:hypothetical protein